MKTGLNAYRQEYGEEIPLTKLRDEQWAVLVWRHRKRRQWDTRVYGPAPDTTGCLAPEGIRTATDEALVRMRAKFREDSRMKATPDY